MNKLTEQEILSYIKHENKETGVKEITREFLESVDLDDVREVVCVNDRLLDTTGKQLFKLDRFTPKARLYAFKPSFAGSQLLLGREDRKLYFSNGVWFCSSI